MTIIERLDNHYDAMREDLQNIINVQNCKQVLLYIVKLEDLIEEIKSGIKEMEK